MDIPQFREPAGFFFLQPNKAPEAAQSHWRKFRRWLTPLLGHEKTPLCRACRRRKLDFRPLLKSPPGSPRGIIYNADLNVLERQNAVQIHGFSWQKAEAARSECSLCELLHWSAIQAMPPELDFLPDIEPFTVTLQPRWDWSKLRDSQKGRLIHQSQIFIQFKPWEKEVLFDIRYEGKPRFRTSRWERCRSPMTFDINAMKHWLKCCDTTHNHPAAPARLTSRMQSIMRRGLFRVINTSTGFIETLHFHAKFVALSYVWGPAPDQANSQPLGSRPLSAHPPTIRDAAVLSSSLGFEWLWVDRVCIDQTNESEKLVLIPYMKDIFAAAELTIVAACGDSAQSGLLGSIESPREIEKPLVSISSVAILPASLPLKSCLEKSIWAERGWTFEEYIFSKRLLFIFKTKALFNCGSECYQDELRGRSVVGRNPYGPDRGIFGEHMADYTSDLHAMIRHKPSNPAELLDVRTFIDVIAKYSGRALTYESDRIAAFAGVILASIDGSMDDSSEQALLKHGHPLRFFEVLLTWEHWEGVLEWSPLPKIAFAPTWSWASASKQVRFSSIRNRLVSDPNPWFRYTSLLENDILALPTGNNSIAGLTGLQLPGDLITDQSWKRRLSNQLSLCNEAKLGTNPLAYNSVEVPKLHIITFMFDARLVCPKKTSCITPEQVMVPKDSTYVDSADLRWKDEFYYMSSNWSVHPELEHHYYPKEINQNAPPPGTFAIITGRTYRYKPDTTLYYSLFIMLLGRTEQRNTYTRAGICRIDNVKAGSFRDLVATGEPRWEYIRIV
ncbi:heterokaryon incompatibility protein-domain-containing protein [Xylaria arbuscula]|nr:heterokaryon incompatibility protein-domain-containing protein [Xylaria arbuscula]